MAGQSSEVTKCVSRICPLLAFRMSCIDRSVEMASLPKKGHIGGIFKAKSSQKVPLLLFFQKIQDLYYDGELHGPDLVY